MSAPAQAQAPRRADGQDPRQFRWVPAGQLVIDQRLQRECDPEKVARIVNEFDWLKFEALTAAEGNGQLLVVEGQHRALARQEIDPGIEVPCMVIISQVGAKAQAQLALEIVQGRSRHTAYEQWRLRYNSGQPHEIFATTIMDRLGLRVGQAASSMTISAVATVRTIIHGGNFSPEAGAELLDRTLTTLMAAFPTYDHESNVTRWNRDLLLAVATTYASHPDVNPQRMARALHIRPASQWVNLGKGVQGVPSWVSLQQAMAAEYNRGKRTGRIEL